MDDSLKRITESDNIPAQTDREIIRYWNERVRQNDSPEARRLRRIIFELLKLI